MRSGTTEVTRLGILGCGRLGMAVAAEVAPRGDWQLVWQHGRGMPPDEPVDVVVDASSPDALEAHLAWAQATETDLVIATTGWHPATVEAFRNAPIGLVTAPNGSLTVALFARFARLLGAYAATLPSAEGFLVEHHHAGKRDAPSGTALRLAEAWCATSESAPRLAISSLRAGHEIGHHRLGLDTPGEVLEIQHRARSRATFAQGLLTAAAWVRGRRGLFTMDDVASAVLDPIVRGAS